MKNLIIALLGFLCWNSLYGQQSVFDCQPQASGVTQNQIYTPNPFFYQRCIVFGQNTNYVYDQNSQYPYADIHTRAGKSITIEPGFRAGEFSTSQFGTGSFLMDIDPEPQSPFDVLVMNYPNIENVVQNARFELGVELPSNIQSAINNFLLDQLGDKINPYLSWEIEVKADFYPVVQPGFLQTVHGFHYVPYQSEEFPLPPPGTPNVEPDQLGSWTQQSTDFPFRIRFAPPLPGDWVGQVHIKTPNGITSSSTFKFTVVPSSIKPALTVGTNKRFLERGGESFMPLGNNLKWPRTTCPYDPELAELLGGTTNIEQYKPYTPPVRSYRKFREQIDALADGGANTFRMIMAPQSNDIEFEKLGNYYDRQHIASEMDKILYKAEERDMLIQWNLQVHFPYTTKLYWIHYWDWEEDLTDPTEYGNCYQSLPNVDKPIDFFEDADARKFYKERLRYIISRWGYSNNIASFELFSEIDQIGLEYEVNWADTTLYLNNCEYKSVATNNGGGACPPDPKYQINQQTIQEWQTEMINYMHNILGHSKHLYQVNYAGDPGEFDDSYGIPDVDFIDRNVYDNANYDYINKTVSFNFPRLQVRSMAVNPDGIPNYFDIYGGKPAWYSETGPINSESKGCDKQIEMLRSQWKMLFSGVSAALDWESDIHQLNAYNNFSKMRTFIQGKKLDEDLWHPGNSDLLLNTSQWEYSSSWNSDMVRSDKKGDLMYLRKGNADEAIGMITNTTYNYYNQAELTGDTSCFIKDTCNYYWEQSEVANANDDPATISWKDKKGTLKLRGMDAQKYRIDYYWAHNPTAVIHTSYGWGPMIQLEYDMKANQSEYIMLFKAYHDNAKSAETIGDNFEEEQLSDDYLSIYPNPNHGEFTVDINMETSGTIYVTVTDVLGRVVQKNNSITSKVFDINISDEKPGIYVVTIKDDNQKWVRKVILQ